MIWLWECFVGEDRAVSEEVVCLKELIEEHYEHLDEDRINYTANETITENGKHPIFVLLNDVEIGVIKPVRVV